jgi:hypothetical protein
MSGLLLKNSEMHSAISESFLIGLLDFFVTLVGDVFC